MHRNRYIVLSRHTGTYGIAPTAWHFFKELPDTFAGIYPSELSKIRHSSVFDSSEEAEAFIETIKTDSKYIVHKAIKYYGAHKPVFDNPLFLRTFTACEGSKRNR